MKNLIFLIGSLLTFPSLAQELSFSTYNQRQGITQPYIYAICQNKIGYLCFSTSEGAYSYDGLSIKRLDKAGQLKEPFFKSMLVMPDNSIYYGSNTGGIFRIKNGKVSWRYASKEHTSPVISIQKVDKMVYAFYQDGLIVEISPGGKRKVSSLEKGYLYSSFAYINGTFVAGMDTGIFFFTVKNGKIKKIKSVSVNNDAVESICVNRGALFLGTSKNGLYIYKGALRKININEKLNSANIKAIHQDKLNSVWISAYGDGVYEIKRNVENGNYYLRSSITIEKGLPSKYVTSIFIDRESNLWLGTLGNGISKLNSNSLVQYDLEAYGFGNAVYSSLSVPKHYCGMMGGILMLDAETDEIKSWPLNAQLPKDKITALSYHLLSKTLFIGTEKNGVFFHKEGSNTLTNIDLSSDNLAKVINHLSVKHGELYVSTLNGLFIINIGNKKIKHFSSKDGMPNNVVYSTFHESTGKTLLGTMSSGIFYLQNDQIHEMNIENPYGLLEIHNFIEDRRGQVWFSTNGQGIFHLSSHQFNRMSATIGLYSDFVYQLTIDRKNTIWCGHRGGLTRVNDQENVIDKFDYTDKIAMDFLINASSVDADGNLWFGTNEGLMKFSILQDNFNAYRALPVIISATVNDQFIDNPKAMELDFNRNKLKIVFQTVSLTFPEEILYQYRLKGRDAMWSVPSKENEANLGQILDGEYEFEVRSKVGNSTWSLPRVLSTIKVNPPFWKTWPFFIFILFGTVAIAMLFSYWRTRALKKQTSILEDKLAIRTKEIQNKNEKITQQFEEMQESIDYGVRIQNSLLPSAFVLKKIMPESFMFFQPKDKVSGDFYYFEKFGDKLIVSVADATGHGVPGAFISLIGFVNLKEIIHRPSISNPAESLSILDYEINTTLGQFNRENDGKDGMDMAICEIDLKTLKVVMASALRPIWIFKNGEFEKIRSSKFSVGGGMNYNNPIRKEFDLEERQLKKGDTIYLFTDGYVDQFGSARDKKLMSKRFQTLISENYHLPMTEQGRIISKFVNDWKGSRDQTDDILVIGLRL